MPKFKSWFHLHANFPKTPHSITSHIRVLLLLMLLLLLLLPDVKILNGTNTLENSLPRNSLLVWKKYGSSNSIAAACTHGYFMCVCVCMCRCVVYHTYFILYFYITFTSLLLYVLFPISNIYNINEKTLHTDHLFSYSSSPLIIYEWYGMLCSALYFGSDHRASTCDSLHVCACELCFNVLLYHICKSVAW